MAKKIIKAQMKQRLDTKDNWAANNPVLLKGELGLVSNDKNLYKVGDGVTAWNDLPFRGFDGTLVHETGDSENAAMSQKGVTESLMAVDAKTNSNRTEITKLGAKLDVFRGGATFIYSEKTEDGLYQVNESGYLYYNDKLYHLPTAIGEKLEIDNMPFSLVIERVENPYVKITGFGLNNLKIKPIYFGNPLTIPTELMPTDSELNEESDKLLPNSVITKEINAVHSEIETMQTEMESQAELIEDLQNTKIDKEADDYYPQLSVGVADNLAGHEDATPSEIGFRRSGGGAILDGNARIEAIKGNSVVWNQLINENKLVSNDASITKTAIGYTITPSGIAPGLKTDVIDGGVTPVVGHKYALLCEKTGGTKRLYLNWGGHNTSLSNPFFTASDSSKTQLTVYSYQETETYTLTKPRLIDLTKMFGAGNEPTTIEEFYARKPLGIDEYAYNEGEVIHNATDKIESVGVNQWDEEWEAGSLSSVTGAPTAASSAIRAKDFIKVLPSSDYYVTAPTEIQGNVRLYFYDADKNFIKRGFDINEVFATQSNAHYMKLIVDNTTTYNNDICINLSDASINGKYFPYVKREQSLDIIRKYFPQGMKSAGSAHDEIRYNKASGKKEYSKGRLKSVDLGTFNWIQVTAPDGFKYFYTNKELSDAAYVNYGNNILTPRYTPVKKGANEFADKEMRMFPSKLLYIRDDAYADSASFKAAMQGVILYYEAAEWEWVELDEADQFKNLDYPVWNVGTENAIANVPSTPLKADIIYGFNAYGVIKELLARVASLEAANASLASQLASVTSHNEEV